MAWSTPLTAVANAALTAAQWNASVRDNLLETSPGKATASGTHFVGNGANVIAERVITSAVVDTSQTTTSLTFTDLATAGPSVAATTGTLAMVFLCAQLGNSGTSTTSASYEISGATTVSADNGWALLADGVAGANPAYGRSSLHTVTAGSNTFKLKYLVSGGTGTFQRRKVQVLAF